LFPILIFAGQTLSASVCRSLVPGTTGETDGTLLGEAVGLSVPGVGAMLGSSTTTMTLVGTSLGFSTICDGSSLGKVLMVGLEEGSSVDMLGNSLGRVTILGPVEGTSVFPLGDSLGRMKLLGLDEGLPHDVSLSVGAMHLPLMHLAGEQHLSPSRHELKRATQFPCGPLGSQ
jgi:hypothetical protein